DELLSQLKQLPIAQLSLDKVVKRAGRQNLPVQSLAELGVQQQNKEPLSRLRQFSERFSGKIVFSVESEGRREALTELLQGIKVRPVVHGSLYQALDSGDRFSLILGAAEHGFIHEELNFALICESDLLGDRVIQRRRKDKKAVNSDTVIRHLAELKPGQPVVHIDHGIGR
ncbi:transcription-repair coupling factor, partial [Vibrio parahaemolyticus]|nr:transcription-repair coupling factor [Vibrio parahaemolyticus]